MMGLGALADFLQSQAVLRPLADEQQRVGPQECCGFILEEMGRLHYHPTENLADKLHAADPESFPRTSRDAYIADIRPLVKRQAQGALLRAIVHTHIECAADFSEEDHRGAFSPDGRTLLFPGVSYAIIEVRAGQLVRLCLYEYAPERGVFQRQGDWKLHEIHQARELEALGR